MKIKPMKHDTRVDLTTWNLDTVNELGKTLLQEKFLECVSEAIEVALEDKADAYFPIEWNFGGDPTDGIGGKPVDDPDIIYISLPLGPDQFENPHWSISLSETVENVIDGHRNRGSDGPILDDDVLPIFIKMRDHFLALAKKIDDEMKIGR